MEALECLEHGCQVGRWRGADVIALIVEDEVSVEVVSLDLGAPVSGVAAFSVLHVLLGLTGHRLVAPSVGADVVAAVSIGSLLVVLVGSGVGIVEDDEDPALLECR